MILIRFKLNYMSKHFADYKWFCRFDDDVFVKVNVFFDLVWPRFDRISIKMTSISVWKARAIFEKNRWPEEDFVGPFRTASSWTSDQSRTRQVRSQKLTKGYGNTEEFGKLEIENYCMGGTGVILSQGLMSEESDSRNWIILLPKMTANQSSFKKNRFKGRT